MGELELAELLRQLLADPSISRRLDQTREGGEDLTGDTLRHVCVEVKRQEQPRVIPWLDQASKASGLSGRIPIVIWRGNGAEWECFLRLSLHQMTTAISILNCFRDGSIHTSEKPREEVLQGEPAE